MFFYVVITLVFRMLENYNISPLKRFEKIRNAFDKDIVVVLETWFHRCSFHQKGLKDEEFYYSYKE